MVAFARRFLLHQHGVRPIGHGGAREDPGRFARTDHAGERPPRRAFADHPQRSRQIGVAQRIAVHRGQVADRLSALRHDWRGGPAADRLAQAQPLRREGLDGGEQACLCLRDGKEFAHARRSGRFTAPVTE